MRKTKNIIKINGHTYDASTGELLSAAQTKTAEHNTPPAAGTVIKPAVHTPKNTHAITKSVPKKDVKRNKAQAAKRSPQPAKTLMRSSVRKPSHRINSHDKTHIKSTSKLPKSLSAIEVKKSVRHVNEKRLSQANRIPKSSKVTKFAKSTPTTNRQHPLGLSAPRKKVSPAQHHATTTHPRRTPQHLNRQKTTADLLEDALHHATSHKQPAHKKHHLTRRQQVAGMSAIVVVSGMLLGLVAVQSAPSIKMRVASAKAGFSAGLPGYSPSGFHLGDLSYGAGAVAMNYKSNSDSDRKFSITQKSSAWDSTTLRDTFVEKSDKNFTAVEDGGLTIYLYGQNNATWVSDGVWYQVQGNGSLSDRQLVDIAKSL